MDHKIHVWIAIWCVDVLNKRTEQNSRSQSVAHTRTILFLFILMYTFYFVLEDS